MGLRESDNFLGFLYVGELIEKPLAGKRLTTIDQHVNWIKD